MSQLWFRRAALKRNKLSFPKHLEFLKESLIIIGFVRVISQKVPKWSLGESISTPDLHKREISLRKI